MVAIQLFVLHKRFEFENVESISLTGYFGLFSFEEGGKLQKSGVV